MSKLSDFYKLKPKFGEYANEEQQKKLKDMEWALVNEEIVPEIKVALSKILSKVQCPLEFSVSYVPGTDLVIDTGENTAHEEPFQPVTVFTHPLDRLSERQISIGLRISQRHERSGGKHSKTV